MGNQAARKAEKAAHAMKSMMRDFLKSHSTGSHKKKKSFTNKSTKSTNRNASPAVTLFENQSGRVLHKDAEVINDKCSAAECSQNNMDNNNKIFKRNITGGCSMNPPAKSICNNGLFTINNPSDSTNYNALQSNAPDPDKRPNEIPNENLSQSSQLNKEHSTSKTRTALSKNQIFARSCNLSKRNHLHEVFKNQVSQRHHANRHTDNNTNSKPTTKTTATNYTINDPSSSIHMNASSKKQLL
jgi:hypothetical protein